MAVTYPRPCTSTAPPSSRARLCCAVELKRHRPGAARAPTRRRPHRTRDWHQDEQAQGTDASGAPRSCPHPKYRRPAERPLATSVMPCGLSGLHSPGGHPNAFNRLALAARQLPLQRSHIAVSRSRGGTATLVGSCQTWSTTACPNGRAVGGAYRGIIFTSTSSLSGCGVPRW